MPVKVLIADVDIDVQEFLNDVLEINFKDVEIVRVLQVENLVKNLRENGHEYNLVLLNLYIAENKDIDIVDIINQTHPELMERIILLDGIPDWYQGTNAVQKLPVMQKPFSLDYFGDVVKKIYATQTA